MPSRKFQKSLPLLLLAVLASPVQALVISEIHYHPPGGGTTLEFVEVTNEAASPEDVSGWAFVEGIGFVFPAGTIIAGNGILVVAANQDAIRAVYGIDNVVGDFSGRLDNGGEALTLVNHVGIVIQSVTYRDEGNWPVGPDGSGHSLALENIYLDSAEAESWSQSAHVGGSPGGRNFFDDPDANPGDTVFIDAGDDWRYAKGTQAFSAPPTAWMADGFDDSVWLVGPSGFGFADDDDATILEDMEGNYTSLAIRKTFVLTRDDLEASGDFFLGVDFDDAFCAFVNGMELVRPNCPEDIAWDGRATGSREAGEEELFAIDRALLRTGENLLAIVGFNRSRVSNDFSLIPRLLHREEPGEEMSFGHLRLRFNELGRSGGAGNGWVELFNPGQEPVELSSLLVTNDPANPDPDSFPSGSVIEGRGFFVLRESETSLNLSTDEVRLFLLAPGGFVVTAEVFDRTRPENLAGPFSEARFPDGGRESWITDVLTPDAENVVPRIRDLVINEIHYHPPEDREELEFLELYHRGTEPLDVSSFYFESGIRFGFPGDTILQPGDYVVLAKDPTLFDRGTYPYGGSLANGGETVRLVDSLGNLVDEVRYFDGGRWPLWPDGGGASLELIDPEQDNDFPGAWGASDESEKAEWEKLSFEVPEYVRAGESELHLLLPERGVCHIDDVSITAPVLTSTAIVNSGEEWKFRKGTGPFSNPPLAWVAPEYDDSGWPAGPSGFGIAGNDGNTVLVDMPNNYTSVALRKVFEIAQGDLAGQAKIFFGIDFDDGFCAFLNGVELARRHCPAEITFDETAPESRKAGEEALFEIPVESLNVGQNVLAVVGYNDSLSSHDFSLIPRVLHGVETARSANHIPNPGFEANTRRWRLEGTHGESRRITTDSHSGDACLQLVATGKGDSACNRVETDTVPNLSETSHEVSLWARWVRGSSLIHVHGEFAPGRWAGIGNANLSHNNLGGRLRMTVPWNLGTPGRENSLRARLLADTGSDNLGPVIADVLHRPLSPRRDEPVRVQARVADSDGLQIVRVLYRRNEADTFSAEELFDDGRHADGDADDGLYGGEIPGNSGTKVLFFIEAEDALGAVGSFPAEAPEKTCLYLAEGAVLDSIQIVMDDKSALELEARPEQSNELLDATFIYHGDKAYYNVGVRYRGSPFGRWQKLSYRVAFNKDQRFHRNWKDLNISNRDREDGVSLFLIRRNGSPGTPTPAGEYYYARTRINGSPFGTPGVFESIDRNFIEKWYGQDAAQGAVCLKANGRFAFGDACDRRSWDQATLLHLDDHSENYRFYWRHAVHQSRDSWDPFFTLTHLVDENSTSGPDFARQLEDVVDVEGFLRALSGRILLGDSDQLFVGNGHNGYMIWDPLSRRWGLIPFDMGPGLRTETPGLLGLRDAGARRILTHPSSLRRYYRILDEYLDGYWSAEVSGPFLNALQASPAGMGASFKSTLAGNASFARGQVDPFTSVALEILNNGGRDFQTDSPGVDLSGEASVRIVDLLASVNGSDPWPLRVEWLSPTLWETPIGLPDSENLIEIFGFDVDGALVEKTSISIATASPGVSFIRGDANSDLSVNLSDAITIAFNLFYGLQIKCDDAADVNDNGVLEISDVFGLLYYLFVSGQAPAQPFPAPNPDATPDELGCGEG